MNKINILILLGLFLIGCQSVEQTPSDLPTEKPTVVPIKKTLYTGSFKTESATGIVEIIQEGENYTLNLKNMNAMLTPDLRLYLIKENNDRIDLHKFEEKPVGEFTFTLSENDVQNLKAIDLYCVFCEKSFGIAHLQKRR